MSVYQLHADNCALNLQQLKGYDTMLMKYGSNFFLLHILLCRFRHMSTTCQEEASWPPTIRLYAADHSSGHHCRHAKDLYLKKVQFLVAMCNMMHFSTVSTSRLKHFQLTRCAAFSAKPRCLVAWLAVGAG